MTRYFRKKHTATPEAKELARFLRNYGWGVELEKWDGHKSIDIAITKEKVNIEVDGKQHNLDPEQALTDLKRTYYSFKKGYVTLRIPNCLVWDGATIAKTAKFIDKFLKANHEQLEDEDYSYDDDYDED